MFFILVTLFCYCGWIPSALNTLLLSRASGGVCVNPVERIREIEGKWQEAWEREKIFEADPDPTKPKMFVTFPYPYLNGLGHVGHLYTFMKAEIYARYMRMRGFNVLFPQGFHATGQPIVAAARRLREGDPQWAGFLKSFCGVGDDEIERFYDPKYWIRHFMRRWMETLRKIGASVDWRRTFHTTELNPAYDRFIRWQYMKLREKGLITRAKHPVVWCPKEQIPVGDHDRSEGEGVVPEEIILIKFRLGGKVLPAGTYRPETTYGATNIWVNPGAPYVEAKVDGETWIVSKEAVEKLRCLGKNVKAIKEYRGADLLGMCVENPATNEKIPVLPATFVDPDFATGVVMSVPAHAPYDWIALEDLKRDPEWKHVAEKIRPRSLIKVSGYSEFPARDAVEKHGIKSQEDVDKLEKATEEIYRKEFYEGRLKEMFGDLAGMTVQEAKRSIVERFLTRNWATTMWILPRPVVCRCGAKCVVRVVDQWFLRYSDPGWKAKAHEVVENSVWIPPEVRRMVHTTIDWLKDWACTRDVRASMGTRLPWDSTQYVESLSDSTVYMAYYTIAKWLEHADEYGIDVSRIGESFFDYVFY
ncbi:TPA: leucine--tRNA ligase, partial [Candidatus Micrarchaeota archaeon]|nr:leucine--tRNA ligase [Candidatus Micrarchaeota archaeon]